MKSWINKFAWREVKSFIAPKLLKLNFYVFWSDIKMSKIHKHMKELREAYIRGLENTRLGM